MFRIYINNNFDHEISLEGDKETIQELYDNIFRTSQEWETDCKIFSFTIGVWNLKESINGCSVAQRLLNFIKNKKFAIDRRNKYLLEYWAFEIKMIEEAKSYRSSFFWQQLTSSNTINTILNQCEINKFLPPLNELFNFLENSDAIKKRCYFQPCVPYDYEIQWFVDRLKSLDDIRIASHILMQCYRGKSSLFFKLPEEINIKIVSLLGNPAIHDEKKATEIAIKSFERIKLMKV